MFEIETPFGGSLTSADSPCEPSEAQENAMQKQGQTFVSYLFRFCGKLSSKRRTRLALRTQYL